MTLQKPRNLGSRFEGESNNKLHIAPMSSVSSALGKRVQLLEDFSHVANVMLLVASQSIGNASANWPCYIAMEQVNLFVVNPPSVGNPWENNTSSHWCCGKNGDNTLVIQPEIGHIGRLRLVVLCEIGSSKPRCLAGFHHVQAVSMSCSSFTAVQKLTHMNTVLHSYSQTNSHTRYRWLGTWRGIVVIRF